MYGPRRWGAGELEDLYILCFKRAALGMAFLCQEAEAIDFSLPGEGTVNSVEEAMAHPAKQMQKCAAALLAKIMISTGGQRGDVRTVGQTRLGMNYTWQMLPPIEAGKDCINRLAMVSFGPKEPPFDKFPAPPIRALFEAEMRLHPPTRFLNITGWTLSLQNMSCDERQVIKHWNHSRSIDVFPTEEPECLGTDSVTWEPNLEGEFDLNEVGGCDLAGSNPCVCAALSNCEWVTSVSGVPRCVYTSRPGVPCEACPNQPRCVITPEKECEMKSTPCACVLRGGGCNWDMATSRCYFDVTASTACIACSRQGFCSLPAVRSKQPENLALMGQEEVGWFINVTFDRDIEFLRLGLGSGVMLQCRSNRPGDWPPTFELEYGQLVIEGSILHINVRGLPNDERRDCDLVIANNAVRDSQDRLPFDGLENNVIFVTLPDGIPPEVVSFEPANSARGVSLATKVHFHFNENIRFYSIGYLELYILGGNRTDRAADIKIAEISVWDEAVAIDRDNRNILHVQLTGLLSTSTYYSLTIPPQTISDISNNPFGGIDRGVYIFQTGAEEIVEELVDDTEEETLTFTIVLVAVGVLVLATAVVAAYLVLETVRKTRRRARVVARRDEKMEEAVLESNAPETARSTKAADLNLDSELEEEWPVSLAPSLKSPTSATASSPKTVQSSGQLLSPQMSPKGRPSVQVFSKPEELKTHVHDQLRHSGNVVSLADLHVKSNSMMRTINGKVEDRSRGRGSRSTTSGSVTAPSSPLGRRHSMTLSPTSPKVEDRRKLKSAQGARPGRESQQNREREGLDGTKIGWAGGDTVEKVKSLPAKMHENQFGLPGTTP
ncbi:menB [Symbiodinium microadriaticum]|nr:menB [Symbiodinium microadriaticum]